MKHLLYGKDETPGIVALHPTDGKSGKMRLYYREGEHVWYEDEDFKPFFWLGKKLTLKDANWFKLEGDGYYKHVVWFDTIKACKEAVKECSKKFRTNYEDWSDPEEMYRVRNYPQQYLMQTGRTLFKGMTFDDILRMQVDIETYTPHSFPNSSRDEDEIVIVACSTNKGGRWLLHTAQGVHVPHGIVCTDEENLLIRLRDLINDVDPDVIEGHNIFKFDFPYILDRCFKYGVEFTVGRDGSEPFQYNGSFRAAERTMEYRVTEIAGRHVIDTYFLTVAYDAIKRKMDDHTLKTAAKEFGVAREGRVYVPGNEIAKTWKENPRRLLEYALDDALETEGIARHLSGSSFYTAMMVPMSYEKIARSGTGGKIESLFVREYLRQHVALPKPKLGRQQHGGLTAMFLRGVVGPVVYADVESLYPSIMLNYNIQPTGDTLKIFQPLLRELTALRFEAKDGMKAAKAAGNDRLSSELDARQSSYKVLINSFYGYLGYARGIFNEIPEADRVATTGQSILKTMVREIEKDGGQIIEIDTDGVMFIPPEHIRGEEEEKTYVKALTNRMPEGIIIGFDGRFEKMISYKRKNYVLKGYDGKLKFKGSSLVSRGGEGFGREFVKKGMELVLNEDAEGLHKLYVATHNRVVNGEIPIEQLSKTQTLNKTLDEYEYSVTHGNSNRSSAYELGKKLSEAGMNIAKGDRVSYYIAGTLRRIPTFHKAKLVTEYSGDEDRSHYLGRFETFAEKFDPLFLGPDRSRIFCPVLELWTPDWSTMKPVSVRVEETVTLDKNDDANEEDEE